MGVNDSYNNDETHSSNEYCSDLSGRSEQGEPTASSILVSMKKDILAASPHDLPPPSSILCSLRDDSPSSSSYVSPPPSPPLSPIPKTSSILMSLKNDTSRVLNSSTSSLCNSPSSSRSRTPSPPGTPSSTPPPSPHLSRSRSPSPSSLASSSSSCYSNSSSTSAPFVLSPPSSPAPGVCSGYGCFVPNCLVCARGAPLNLTKSPTWSSIMRVVFYTLLKGFPEKQFFNLRTDVYVFMANHWDKLCPSKDASHNWKKQIQDMLSHSKNMFESGTGFYKQNGFWRLKKPQMDPWAIVKPSFHHRPHHRSSKTRCHSSDTSEEPPAKKLRESCDLDLHIPPLVANKSLVGAFRALKNEMAMMREQMQSVLDSSRGCSFRGINFSFLILLFIIFYLSFLFWTIYSFNMLIQNIW
eukprot:Phypoly_transcript_07800.p1 GENE.Phypoly_transcript_07800~~Phypoly_transcript_07800.p1  ORF type:complete len:411 (+),score=52.76 Phypoly_transcript_07800:97-1329(+)